MSGGIPIDIDPTLVALGPLLITWHGFFTAVGVAAGVWLAARLATQRGLDADELMNVAMWGIVGAVVGSRLVHVIDQWGYYSQNPLAILRIYEGGLAIWGTVIGGPLAGAIYAWRKHLRVGQFADLAAPALALGLAIGRIGDIINGEHHGLPAPDFPLAVVYVHPNTLGELNVPVHLAVGYEMLWDLLAMGVILWLLGLPRGNRSRLPADGMVFWGLVLLYSVGVFVIRFWRVDAPLWAWGLTQAQLLAVGGFVVSIWLLAYLWARQHRSRLDAALEAGDESPATSYQPPIASMRKRTSRSPR
ncbi:MAG: prolipoprotein diacylglyceryl transferase [Chloroflexi bacterium]|nr:prolipoprotein diacylglyceryl transferase [Chloroflexota bacterium]